MVAKEFSCLKPVQENTKLQDFDDEQEETLSLCDLAVDINNADYWNNFSKQEQRSSSDQDFFEFFSEDFTASTYPTDNIIFCGKLIPYREPTTIAQNYNHNTETPTKQEKPWKSCIFPWKSHSFNKSRRSLSSKPQQEIKSYKKSLSMPVSENHAKCSEKFDFSVKKVSIMATPVKSRWYLFAFGSVGRIPMEMELKDMKTRQSRMFRSKDNGVEIAKTRRRRGKGLWGLLRI